MDAPTSSQIAEMIDNAPDNMLISPAPTPVPVPNPPISPQIQDAVNKLNDEGRKEIEKRLERIQDMIDAFCEQDDDAIVAPMPDPMPPVTDPVPVPPLTDPALTLEGAPEGTPAKFLGPPAEMLDTQNSAKAAAKLEMENQ